MVICTWLITVIITTRMTSTWYFRGWVDGGRGGGTVKNKLNYLYAITVLFQHSSGSEHVNILNNTMRHTITLKIITITIITKVTMITITTIITVTTLTWKHDHSQQSITIQFTMTRTFFHLVITCNKRNSEPHFMFTFAIIFKSSTPLSFTYFLLT